MADAEGNRYGPYDIEVAGSESEALTEDAWFDLFGGITGVKSGGDLTFNGLTANLSPIDARVHGSYLIRTDPWSDASPATANPAPPRRDLLVGRRQRTIGEGAGAVPGKTFLTVLRGTPAATPAEPTDYDPEDDEPLWSWQVPGNAGTVVTGIRDLRKSLPDGGGPPGFTSTTARDLHFPAPTVNQVCTVNGGLQVHNGTRWVPLSPARGIATPTTDTSGLAMINHPLGVTPSAVEFTVGYFGGDLVSGVFKPTVGALSPTQIQLVAMRTDGNTRLAGTQVQLHWVAWP